MKKISKEEFNLTFTTTVSYEENGVSVYEAINLEVLENCEVDIEVEYRRGGGDLIKYGCIEHINCFSISSLFNDGEKVNYEDTYLPQTQSQIGCLQFIVNYLKTLEHIKEEENEKQI
tara:strand:+ start:1597 stop:1947 length:351 start_codon:yes stop_codon:yes gene_type:complete